MFFVLSKILNFLTLPTTWIVGLFLFYVIFKTHKWRNKALKTAIILLVVLTNPFLSTTCFKAWEIEPTSLVDLQEHDIAVVFSGITISDKEPQDRIYFNKASDRIMMAVHLYKIGKVNKILISGGAGTVLGYGKKEAETLKEFLLMLGLPEEDILQEKEANNTYQNALYTKQKLEKEFPNAKLILITSAFHMRRSYGCAQQVDLKCTPFAVDYHTIAKFHSVEDFIFPQSYALYNWSILIHELTGYTMYWLTGKL